MLAARAFMMLFYNSVQYKARKIPSALSTADTASLAQ
jgi:hypothetical protein